ncbi:YceI family protein [Olivibacter domesticus]|uniref:Polyisoprenoid-binding protein YceI n=1 Tax=Olivibacter domesticus TaxID=407022 RepID=A0A1H7WMH8_OLID1|nr:YceI family protein [Olivibacter domesticus]SEM22534.1 Polyisoprenoid-binding protein YceI [Olivibacter domesticus]
MAAKTTWNIDKVHSEISFKVKHMMISTVTGYFEDFNATAETSNDDFVNADFSFTAKTSSINTKNGDRDGHLKSDDFFNAEKYPELLFKSTSFDGETLVGDLTIRDITKEIKMYVDFNGIVVDPYGQTKAGFEATGTINRKDFNLTWSAVTDAGSIVVSDTVKLIVDLEFNKE